MSDEEVVEEAVEEDPEKDETGDDDSNMVDLDYEYCLARSAYILDKATTVAERVADLDGLLKVSFAWLNMAERVSGVEEQVDPAEENRVPAGFGVVHDSTAVD